MDDTLQTVHIHMAKAPFPLWGLEPCPTLPRAMLPVKPRTAVRVSLNDGRKVVWDSQGNVEMIMPDGSLKLWYRKVTLKEAITLNKSKTRTSFQFNSDGSVFAYMGGAPYYWPAKEAEPILGPFETSDSYDVSHGGWIFDSDDLHCDCSACDPYVYDYGDRYD
jgi:hypothetical protein